MSKLVRLDHVGIIAETWAQASDILERQMGLPLDTDITKLENGIESLLFEPEQTYNYFVKVGIGETRIEVLIPKPGSETGTTRRLARFGYAPGESGVLDQATVEVIEAFQRHFRPRRIDGAIDRDTVARLDALMALVDREAARD